jgi:hypothetical protein
MVVEGEDDERIWQQAVRSSENRLKLDPVACDGVAAIGSYEQEIARIVRSVYDDARACSLRDGDGAQEEMSDLGAVVHFRLRCRAAENLLLTDEVLQTVDLSFGDVTSGCEAWLEVNEGHPKYPPATHAFSSRSSRSFY